MESVLFDCFASIGEVFCCLDVDSLQLTYNGVCMFRAPKVVLDLQMM